MAEEVSPDAVEREKQALRDAFTYRSLGRDLDWLLDDPDRALFAEANRAGHALYPVASAFVLDCYYERGALEPLVTSYSGQPYRVAARFDRLLQALQQAGRFDLIERFWTAIARLTRAEFLYQRPRRDHGDHAGAEEYKRYALEAYGQGIDWMDRLGRRDAAAALARERDAVRDERMAPLPPPSDPRRIDEPVFWDLLATTRAHAATTLEQMAALGAALRCFKAAEIKRFASHYGAIMRKLHHWDVWALAYAARGGCSDEAFEAFRSWLVLQGDPALATLAVADAARAAERVPPEPDLPEGGLMPIIADAFLERRGTPLDPPPIDRAKPGGTEWAEETLATSHPALTRHYASARRE